MSVPLAPEIFFGLRKVIEVVERLHATLRFAFPRRSRRGAYWTRDRWLLRHRRRVVGRLIPFPDDLQPFQREKFVYLLNVARSLRDQRRLPSRGDHARIFTQYAFDALQNSVHEIGKAVEKACLHGLGRIRADNFSRITNLHAPESRRTRKKRLGGNANTRRQRSAQ